MRHLLVRPGWIATHLAVIAIAITFSSLGLWQLDRSAQVKAENRRLEQVMDGAPLPLEESLAAGDVDLRPTVATGTYQTDQQVQLSPRSRNERPGFDVLTPFTLPDGRTLIVDRGWLPLDSEIPPPPSDPVTVTGRLRLPATARQVLPPGGDRAELVNNVDLTVLGRQVDQVVEGAYLEVVDDRGSAAGELPRPAEPVVLDDGPHLPYAFQWFAFTLIGLIGYPLLLRRRMADQYAIHTAAAGKSGADQHSPVVAEPDPPASIESRRISQ
ncbi:MAG: SURF1 family protein [Euzebya sp.]